jgi:excisionase family DNA binding protein
MTASSEHVVDIKSPSSIELRRNTEARNIERPITCEEAAALLRVHPRTVKRMAGRAELPGHFRFGRWYFYPSELDSWMRTELNSVSHP